VAIGVNCDWLLGVILEILDEELAVLIASIMR
jgi:hypothetical protein